MIVMTAFRCATFGLLWTVQVIVDFRQVLCDLSLDRSSLLIELDLHTDCLTKLVIDKKVVVVELLEVIDFDVAIDRVFVFFTALKHFFIWKVLVREIHDLFLWHKVLVEVVE